MNLMKPVAIALSLFFSGCSANNGNQYDSYMGYWQQNDTKRAISIAHVIKDGESFLIKENILSDKDKPMLLSNKDGKLSVNIDLGSVELGLSEDKKTLYIAKKTFQKIDEKTAMKHKQEYDDCRLVQNNYTSEAKEQGVYARAFLPPDKKTLQENINNKYRVKFDKLPNCQRPFN